MSPDFTSVIPCWFCCVFSLIHLINISFSHKPAIILRDFNIEANYLTSRRSLDLPRSKNYFFHRDISFSPSTCSQTLGLFVINTTTAGRHFFFPPNFDQPLLIPSPLPCSFTVTHTQDWSSLKINFIKKTWCFLKIAPVPSSSLMFSEASMARVS